MLFFVGDHLLMFSMLTQRDPVFALRVVEVLANVGRGHTLAILDCALDPLPYSFRTGQTAFKLYMDS